MTNCRAMTSILTIVLFAVAPCIGSRRGPVRAIYEVLLPEDAHGKQVRSLEIAEAPCDGRPNCRWYRMIGTKVSGDSYTLWFVTDAEPFTAAPADITFHRYILQEPNRPAVEYVDAGSGEAMVPLFHFVEELLPRADGDAAAELFETGTYLGHPLIRTRMLEGIVVTAPSQLETLRLRGDLIVGTSRNFRDDGKGRASREHNYTFVPFTQNDYEQMIAAGINYFTARGPQVNWICHKPVFYDGFSPEIAFPEELYRPNFRGLRMFLDEPACRLAGKYPEGASLQTAVDMIHEHIRHKLYNVSYRTLLNSHGIDTGTMSLVEPAIPIWETYIGTSYYQLEANPYGIVQECRWRIDPNADSEQILMLQRVNEEFGVNIPVTPENLFTWFYSQIRGPALAFGAKWGMSIYGQAEPHLRIASMQLAYDMGAEFVWFWTSDHDHHVPYTEQLELARAISEYADAQPPRDLDTLRGAADVAVVLPYGYTLPTVWQMFTWGTHIYPLDRTNSHGLTYRQVLGPAVCEIARCLGAGISYDVVPAGDLFNPRHYRRVFRVRADGSVRIGNR